MLSIGGTLKITSYLGGGATFGLIPTVQLSYYGEAVVSYQHYDFYGRIYPFGGGFFIGAGAGYVTVEGTLTNTFDYMGLSQDYESKGSVRTLVLTPVLGYLHTVGSGFSLGLDAGVQLPIAPSEVDFESRSSGDVPQQFIEPYRQSTDQAVRDTLEKVGRTPLPTFNVRLGWLL